MAKRSRAPARRKPATQTTRTQKKSGKSKSSTRKSAAAKTERAQAARRGVCTPELLAFMRHRVEQTDDTWSEIGMAAGMDRDSVRHIARREKWIRYVRPPRDLPRAVMLLADAEALEQRQQLRSGNDGSGTSEADDVPAPSLADTIARLHRLVLAELAEMESVRKHASRRPYGSATAVRTLSALTETLQKLQRLQPDHANSGPDDDDMPSDIDEFRIDLARRIEVFIAERNGVDVSGTTATAMAAEV